MLPTYYAACSVDLVISPRPASRPAIEISSSMASQCRPTRVSSTWLRSTGVARNNRGNHASGTPSVRPSVNSTHIVCSSKRTLVAEMVMQSIVARMERSAIREQEAANKAPDFAEFIIGRAFARPVGSIRATLACASPKLGRQMSGETQNEIASIGPH
jgi:hypothetical protein